MCTDCISCVTAASLLERFQLGLWARASLCKSWFIHVYLKLIQCYPFLKLLNRGISLTGSVYRSSLSLLRSGIMLATFLLFGTKRYIFSYFNQQLYIPVTGLATVAITKLGSMFQYLIFLVTPPFVCDLFCFFTVETDPGSSQKQGFSVCKD